MLVFAHRGASGHAPENTFAAFDLARDLGADGLETDVRLTRDGVLILLHDSTLDRTTDGVGRVGRKTWADIERLDAGRWFGPEFMGERVARLDTFLDRYAGVFRICLEVKTRAAVGPLVRLVEHHGLAACPDVEVTSFSWPVVERLRQALPGLAVGQLTHLCFLPLIDRTARTGVRHIWPRASALTPGRVARAHALGMEVRAWEVRDRSLLGRAIEAGADGVVLDYPDWVQPRKGTLAGPASP